MTPSTLARWWFVAALAWSAPAVASGIGAQQAPDTARGTARCDSIVAAARADSIAIALYVSVMRVDGMALPPRQAELLSRTVGVDFVPPRPFKLSVFSGPALMRGLLPITADTAPGLRAPTLTGIYRVASDKSGKIAAVGTVRISMMAGFDSAAVLAMGRTAAVDSELFIPPEGDDSMQVDVRISTDSTSGAYRFISGSFPRMPVKDAVPSLENPAAEFPDLARLKGLTEGEVVLRFVVDLTGDPVPQSLELVRATDESFVRSAIEALPKQRFAPASIHGCPVAQLVEYPFSFVLPAKSPASSP